MIQVKEIAFHSAEYDACKALRNEVLREPLGLTLNEQDVAGEEHQLHLAAYDGTVIFGTLLLKPLPGQILKFRQMAVSADYQGRGAGRLLIAEAERLALAKGFRQIELNARLVALGFYEKLGYRCEGEQFSELALPHVKLVKAVKSVN